MRKIFLAILILIGINSFGQICGSVDSVVLVKDTLKYYIGATGHTITPVVGYDFTGLVNWDKLRYNSSIGKFVNFRPTFTSSKNPAIKYLVKDTVTNQEYYTDIPESASSSTTSIYSDTTYSIQELDSIPQLADAQGNAAVIDGRLWIKANDTAWRRQAYDSTYSIVSARPTSYILDDYPSAAAAYSLRKLRSAYAGSAIRVRRSSDLAEQDIGFVSNVLDTASLLSFVGANNGYVIKWYDQSGHGVDLINTTAFFPIIVFAGVLIKSNGKPAVDFGTDANNRFTLFPTGFLNGATTLSYFQTAEINDFGGSNGGVLGPSSTTSVGLEILQVSVISRPTFLRINGTVRNDNAGSGYRLWNDAAQSLTTIFGNSTSVAAYKNSAAVTLTSSAAMPALNFNGVYALGEYSNSNATMRGKISELIIYTSNQTSNRAGIEANINAYYATF